MVDKRDNPMRAVRRWMVVAVGLAAAALAGAQADGPLSGEAQMMKATPILFVEDVQKSVDFFVEKLGFTKTIEIPSEHGLQFAAVVSGEVEIMFQARGMANPTFSPAEMAARVGQALVYFEIDDFEKIVAAAKGAEIVKAPHVTDYGSREIYFREPGGNVLGFAKHNTSPPN